MSADLRINCIKCVKKRIGTENCPAIGREFKISLLVVILTKFVTRALWILLQYFILDQTSLADVH